MILKNLILNEIEIYIKKTVLNYLYLNLIQIFK